MKKYIFIVIALASVLCACSREEESLFDKSAAERAKEALENGNTVLTGAEHGWEMLYFANPASRGYNLLLRFKSNGQVIATAKNSLITKNKIVTDSISTWAVKNDYGPIITFDTYNSILHAWADPRTDGSGYEGDYEFLILHADSSYVKLKGKKHGGYCYLYPLKEETDPAEYFAEVEAVQKRLFANQNLFIYKTQDGVERLLHLGNEGIFALTKAGEIVNVEDPDIFPLCETRDGIQFSYGVDQIQECYFRLEGDKLTNGSATMFVGATDLYFYNYMQLEAGRWNVNLTEMSDSLLNALDAANEEIKTIYKNKKKGGITGLSFLSEDVDKFVLAFSYIGKGNKASTYYYRFELKHENGLITLTYLEPADENARLTIEALPASAALIHSLEGVFTPSVEDIMNPTFGLKLSNNSNAGLWFNTTGTVE